MRRKGGWATASPPAVPGQLLSRVDGQILMPKVGDLVVSQGSLVLDVVDEKTLEANYDIRVEGEMKVPPAVKRALEDRLGLGSCASGASLLAAVTRLAKISVGEIEIQFTPGQLEELGHRASKNGRAIRAELQSVVKRLESELFHNAPLPAGNGSR